MGQKPSDIEHLLKQSQKELLWLQRQLSFISNGGPPCILSTNKVKTSTCGIHHIIEEKYVCKLSELSCKHYNACAYQ